MGSRTFKSVLAGSVCALALSTVAMAQDAAKTFDVPAGDLAPALDAYIKQSGEQLIYRVADVRGMKTSGVRGALSSDEALQQLLAGTALKVQRDPSGLIAIASIADPQSSGAGGGGADAGTVQALVVTAQKREENIQDVPIAMSAFTQEDLTKSQVAGGPDLMTQVPNFTFTKTNFSGYSIQIRGIGTQAISATVDPAVAVAFNNTPFIRNRFFEQEFYDLERVEVLRGPQGTLYGRNATAGVVNIISAKPNLHDFQAKISADVGNYSSHRLEGMLNLPLVDDKVAFRLAGAWTKRDGYDTNQVTDHPIDGRDLWSTRASLRIEPTDGIRANLIWEHFQENDDRLRSGKQLCHKDVRTQIGDYQLSPSGDNFAREQARWSLGCAPASLYSPDSFETPNGFSLPYYGPLAQIFAPTDPFIDAYASTTQSRNLRVIESSWDPQYRAKSDLGELQLQTDLGHNLTLSSETGYNRDGIYSLEDFNRFTAAPHSFVPPVGTARPGLLNNGIFCDPQLGCADHLIAVDISRASSAQFAQEFRLSSDYDGAFNFSLGVNFLRYDTEDKYYVFINTLSAAAANGPDARLWLPPWGPGSDNHECLKPGMLYGDYSKFYDVARCVYIDPNPLNAVNDLGHNYFLSKNPYKLISYAVFGEAYYKITDGLKLTAGLRWTVDKKEAPEIPSWVFASQSVGYPVIDVVRQEWREPTGRLALDWKPHLSFTDETLLYVSYARGYKAGGANPPPATIDAYGGDFGGAAVRVQNSLLHPKTFNPEFVNAFEVGSKNTLLDGRLTLNGNAFYYDYTGYQISQIVDRSAINYNFDAKVWGLELEADWRPIENLRLGFKGGFENTRVAKGSKAIDVMDRTAGDPNYVVMKPFPTQTSNCILPVWLVTFAGRLSYDASDTVPPYDYCTAMYQVGVDPVTELPYVKNPTELGRYTGFIASFDLAHGYQGLDPTTIPNNGEGIAKDLSGHELPNAPHYTATITADYTLPLPNDWLATLHTDLYYQSEAWTRIFNTPGYDKLKAYNNINVAAIFSNEDRGWQVMAYVKNVLDKTNITGAFLNSDDTGLTTNVFLNEPRLYGIRITKSWTGAAWWPGGAGHSAGQPYPFTLELGGSVDRNHALTQPVDPPYASAFSPAINPFGIQNRPLDWGNGSDVRIAYQPVGGRWSASASLRIGKTNGSADGRGQEAGPTACNYGAPYQFVCPLFKNLGRKDYFTATDYAFGFVKNREEHELADFMIGQDLGLGSRNQSTLRAGLRYAHLKSQTDTYTQGIPDWIFPADWLNLKYSQHHRYTTMLHADRSFDGAGPAVDWEDSMRIMGDEADNVALEWSAAGGVLFGRQKTSVNYDERTEYFNMRYHPVQNPPTYDRHNRTDQIRDKHVSVPVLDLSLGLSYSLDRFKVGAGYRWERYYNAIDGGVTEHKSYDRTIDGPYFKVSVGFGG